GRHHRGARDPERPPRAESCDDIGDDQGHNDRRRIYPRTLISLRNNRAQPPCSAERVHRTVEKWPDREYGEQKHDGDRCRRGYRPDGKQDGGGSDRQPDDVQRDRFARLAVVELADAQPEQRQQRGEPRAAPPWDERRFCFRGLRHLARQGYRPAPPATRLSCVSEGAEHAATSFAAATHQPLLSRPCWCWAS